MRDTDEGILKTILDAHPEINLEQHENDLPKYIYIRKLFLCEYFRTIVGTLDDDDKQVIDQIIKKSFSNKEYSPDTNLKDELNSDINKLKIYNYIKMQVHTINDDYKEIDYKTIIARLVEKYLGSEKSYEEVQGEIDDDLRKIMKGNLQSSNDIDAIYTATSLNTNSGDMRYDANKAVNIAAIFQKIQENPTLSSEEKAISFNNHMQNVIIPYIKENLGEDFVVKQLTSQYKQILNGTKEYTLEELLTYDVMKNIFSSLEKKEGFFTTEVNVRLFSTIDDKEELITADGQFNKNALNFEGLDQFYNLRVKDDSEFKIESILWFQFVPKKLIEALKTVKEEEKSEVVLDFIKFYLNELNKYFEEKGISVTLTLESALASLEDEQIPIYFQGQERQFSDWKHLISGEIDKVESIEEKDPNKDLDSPLELSESDIRAINEHLENGSMMIENPKVLVYKNAAEAATGNNGAGTAVSGNKGSSNAILIYALFGLSILLTIFIWTVVIIYK